MCRELRLGVCLHMAVTRSKRGACVVSVFGHGKGEGWREGR